MLKNISVLLLLILLLFSCKITKIYKPVKNKYREKSPINVLNIDSTKSNISVTGWGKNFIEIETLKKIKFGLKGDFNLITTDFKKEKNILFISVKIPARITGNIDLKISVPYTLLKIDITNETGNIKINRYLGDLVILNNSGSIDTTFNGNILRIDSVDSKINTEIESLNSTDIIINNKNGDTIIKINNLEDSSFLDIKSETGNIDLLAKKNLSFSFSIISKNKPMVSLPFEKNIEAEGDDYYINGIKEDKNNCFIDIINKEGKTILKDF